MKRISYFSKTRKFVGNIMKEQSSLNKNREEVSNVMPPSPLIISCNTSRYFIGQRNYRSWNLPKPVGWLCWSPKTCGEATPPRRSSILRGRQSRPPQIFDPAGRLRPPAGWLRQPSGGLPWRPGLRPGWLRQPFGPSSFYKIVV